MANKLTRFALCLAALMMIDIAHQSAEAANPSFRCTGNLNRSEAAICQSDRLARLDREMVAYFNRLMAGLSERGQRRLRSEQTEWWQGRNACRSDRRCIERAYLARISALESMSESEPRDPPARGGSQQADEVVVTVLPDGTLEKRLADGTIFRRFPNGQSQTTFPDGRQSVSLRSTGVQVDNLPDLPPEVRTWGAGLEATLLIVLENVLTDEEYAAYLQTEAGKDGYALIDWRVDSLNFLTAY